MEKLIIWRVIDHESETHDTATARSPDRRSTEIINPPGSALLPVDDQFARIDESDVDNEKMDLQQLHHECEAHPIY